jgi:hypothetical protein
MPELEQATRVTAETESQPRLDSAHVAQQEVHDQPTLSPEVARLLERLRLGYKPLWQRLEELRSRARGGARTATWLAAVFSVVLILVMVLLLGLLSFVGGMMTNLPAGTSTLPFNLTAFLFGELGLILLLAGWAMLLSVVRLLTAHKLFAHYYYDAVRGLHTRGDALLYCDDSFHLLLREARQRTAGWQGLFQPKDYFHKVEDQLEYCAHQFTALRKLGDQRQDSLRSDIQFGIQHFYYRNWFQIPGVVWGPILLGGLVFYPLLGFLLAVGFGMAPRYIISQARLVALLDYLSGKVDDTPMVLPAVMAQSSQAPVGLLARWADWWRRQQLPWACNLRAPD